MNEKKIIFSTEQYRYLKEEILSISDIEDGLLTSKHFPDGEKYHRILSNVSNRNIVFIGGTINDTNTLELYDIALGLMHAGARSLQIVIPYFGYATMERSVMDGEIVKAKNRAILLSSIPSCAVSNKIYLMDLHAEGIPYYFENDTLAEHIYCKKLILESCAAFGTDFVLAATDAGRAKWVESLANEMGVQSAFVYKHRISEQETEITGVNAEVQNKTVVIYDDMIRTGGSLMQAAEAYKAKGASKIKAITTHGLFSNQALQRIEKQGIIEQVISTNTHPYALQQNSKLLSIKSVATLIFDKLKSN